MQLEPEITEEILHSSGEAIVVVDDAGKIIFVNRPAEILFGYDADELTGNDVESQEHGWTSHPCHPGDDLNRNGCHWWLAHQCFVFT